MVRFLALVNTKGLIRFVRIFNPIPSDETEFEQWLVKTIKMCLSNDRSKAPIITVGSEPAIVYKRFASLYFIAGVEENESEFEVLELLDHIIEILDLYFEDVVRVRCSQKLII
ncbi:hypothetical protein DSO57_1002677 [Entomophthora muscae]|uniref:Uncharacterized protein n=1 Tax=Entomophthora muscae TaxID=34485 RepID=A0ACC2UIC3_9FUNG|nr:hypothetical protein DSO57_1002677 [Entomophthora muscae]